jgi:hypothetical protein
MIHSHKIKRDQYGLFVKTDGSIFRPEPAVSSYPVKGATAGASEFNEGDEVEARHMSCTPFARVETEEVTELWHSHGCYYYQGRRLPSIACWKPKPVGESL